MNWRNIGAPLLGAMVVVVAYQSYGWSGVAAAATGLVMWLLLHFTRLMAVLRKAAQHPMGYVASAVMLNAKLRAGATLMHVVAMTQALGALQSEQSEQPEIYRWTDTGGSHVTAEFRNGRLVAWTLWRPDAESTP